MCPPLSAAEYLFSVSSRPFLKSAAKFERGWSRSAFECGADDDHSEYGRLLLTTDRGRPRLHQGLTPLSWARYSPCDVNSGYASLLSKHWQARRVCVRHDAHRDGSKLLFPR